ncbi:MAG: UDP-2,3-diacylglucosamine diphosphatase [Gammaproteobacteria bacterium]|nr:UDP-2,3-diacylglucosamine diphosphatase [Gammaproteobacteria bacterium]
MAQDYFIADLHLDPSRGEITTLFIDWLGTLPDSCQRLFILGDLFEVWIGDDAIESWQQPVIDAIHQLSKTGIDIFFLAGNRDFLIAKDFIKQTGMQLLHGPMVMDIQGTTTLLLHGDELCTDDHEYQAFRSQVRSPDWQQGFLAKSIAERRAIAQELRDGSVQANQGKSNAIMDVNAEAVSLMMQTHNVRHMIHGHTHRPAIHELDSGQRMVVGDWYQQGSVLICGEGGCRLQVIPGA